RDDELLDVLAATERHVQDAQLRAALSALRGRILERQGRDEDASQAFAAAVDGERTALLGLSRLATRAGRPAEAATYEESFLEGAADAELAAAVARRRAGAGEADSDRLAQVAGQDPLVLEALAEVHERGGRPIEQALALHGWAQVEPAPARRAEVL